jgi:hypothetical protein
MRTACPTAAKGSPREALHRQVLPKQKFPRNIASQQIVLLFTKAACPPGRPQTLGIDDKAVGTGQFALPDIEHHGHMLCSRPTQGR